MSGKAQALAITEKVGNRIFLVLLSSGSIEAYADSGSDLVIAIVCRNLLGFNVHTLVEALGRFLTNDSSRNHVGGDHKLSPIGEFRNCRVTEIGMGS